MQKPLSLAFESFHAMVRTTLETLPYIAVGVVVFGFFFLGARLIGRLVTRITHLRNRHFGLAMVFGRLAEGALLLLGVLVGLMIAIPSFRPAQLIQILGIGSVAIGFAFRDIFQNFLAGIILLLTEPFQIDDQIIVGAFEGTVERIQTRATFIRTYDGRRIVIPNAVLFADSVIVNTAFPQRRLQYDVGIGYGDDVEEARKLILDALHALPSVLQNPAPEVLVTSLGDYSITLRVRWWIDPPRKRDTFVSTDEVLSTIKLTLSEHGIDLPFPTQQVLFHDQTEAEDGNRAAQREGWPARHGEATTPRYGKQAQRDSQP